MPIVYIFSFLFAAIFTLEREASHEWRRISETGDDLDIETLVTSSMFQSLFSA